MKPIDKDHLREIDKKYKCDEWGKKSRVFYKKESVESLGLKYKPGRAIKVIVANDLQTMMEVSRMAVIQTFYYYHGLAPKVYRIGELGEYPYLEVQFIPGGSEFDDKVKKQVRNLARTVDWFTCYDVDLNIDKNYLAGRYLDFHGFDIDWDKFKTWMVKEINNRTHWGHLNDNNERYAYQQFDELEGKRKTDQRVKEMGLDKFDFKGKTVLDIGCNLGIMSRYAKSMGAERVLGVDEKSMIMAADLFNFYMMSSMPEFEEKTLTGANLVDCGAFDVVFYFAMVHSLGYPKELRAITRKLLIFEGHDRQDERQVFIELIKIFNRVEFRGFTRDRGIRPVFWCYK
ncbi:MAG: hypothetical protein U1E54_03830 [Candidatus Levybacteria bacterium]|nr:hypothetical protein [Candidatus Levybacteria bacterium]